MHDACLLLFVVFVVVNISRSAHMKPKIHLSRKLLLALAGGLLVPLTAMPATTFLVTATVDQTCELGTHSDVIYGTLTPGATGPDQNNGGAVQWRCSDGTSADIELTDGLHASGSQRRMQHGTTLTEFISYDLCQDDYCSGTGTRWGLESATEENNVTGTGLASWGSETIYSEIADGAYDDAEFGSYSDTITVSITINP